MVRVRFAPSPTGFLHQGNVRTALFNFLFARHEGGKLILRIEDTDQERSQADYEAAIFADLKWLGFDYDEGPDRGGEFGPYRQSERFDIYKKYLLQLEASGKVYPCFCTHEELEADRRRALANGQPYRYSGKCRELSAEDKQAKIAAGVTSTYRFIVGREIVKFNDLVYGEKVFDTGTMGDFVIARSNELPLYLFTCAIDDCLMQITHVIRGEDGMSNTPRQILIQKALGLSSPQFAHLPLILGPDHTLLSKRNGSMSVAELKAKGYLPEAILNYLALLGWSPPGVRETIEISTLIEKFELPRVSRGSAIFDWAKLNHINQYYITQLSDEDYLKKAKAFLSEGKFDSNNIPGDIFDKTLIAVRSNIETLSEIPTWITLLLGEPQVTSAEGLEVYKIPESRKVLQSMLELMQNSPEVLASQDYDHLMEAVKKQTKIKGKKLFMPIRVALTGGTEGPELVSLITSLGKTKVLERINRGIENLQQPGSN